MPAPRRTLTSAPYRCRDPEGHMWTIAQFVEEVSREQAAERSGFKITGWV